MIIINRKTSEPIYMQIYNQMIQNIARGTYPPHEKVQSIRELAKVLDVSVKTVKTAYEQLLLEGYIYSKERSGYFANKIDKEYSPHIVPSKIVEVKDTIYRNVGSVKESFDKESYNRIRTQVIRAYPDFDLESSKNGEPLLRKEIIKFVSKYRNVTAHENQVVVANNTRTLLYMILSLIDKPFIAYESPGYEKAERLFKSYSVPHLPIPMTESGIDISSLERSHANLVYVTPTHQYPTGTTMPVNKRLNLISWAHRAGSYIIEDDYNGILRYTGNPIPSMQSLDNNEKVIYMGSFQTLLSSSTKVSFMILPPDLIEKFEQIKHAFDYTVSRLTQLTLAHFLKEGHFDRHIKRVRNLLARKASIIEQELDRINIEYTSFNAGTHVLIHVDPREMQKYKERAERINIYIQTIPNEEYILLNYRGLIDQEIPEIIFYLFYEKHN